MIKILRYRIVWEDGVNSFHQGPQAVEIETPDYLKAMSEYKRGNLSYGSRRLECDVEYDNGQTDTLPLYQECRNQEYEDEQFKAEDWNGEWTQDGFDNMRCLRDRCLTRIEESIKHHRGDYDTFKTDQTPFIIAQVYQKDIKKYEVSLRENNSKETTYYNTIDEVIEFIKGKPFGVNVSILGNDGWYETCYEEQGRCDHHDFYLLKKQETIEFYGGGDSEDDRIIEVYADTPLCFKDLDDLREYALKSLCTLSWGKCRWDNDVQFVATQVHFTTAKEKLEEDEHEAIYWG